MSGTSTSSAVLVSEEGTMELLHDNSTVRPIATISSSSIPALKQLPHSYLWRRILGKAALALLLVSLLSAVSAAQKPDASAGTPLPSKSKHSVQLNVDSETTNQSFSSDDSSNIDGVSSTTNFSNTNNSSVQATVNGQSVNIPDNGSTEQTITNPDGSTTNVSITHNSSASASSFSSTVTSTSSSSNNQSRQEARTLHSP